MEYVAEIKATSDSDPLRLDDWMAYIASADDFDAILGSPGINPANGQPITLHPPANAVRLIISGSEVGGFLWGPEDQHCILVCHAPGQRDLVLNRALQIANVLNADLIQWDSTPPA
ncbi:hypothetical protein LOC67_16900 [Stieleria sp. JC731]|uniref:hypothetical protein n=1 Tax=Stieleria sp. JC731 TaxID=2894195 RepID=UPI001E30CB9B|nr:hypothetical protein [Stieleria sp. JC731]MCC9602236.1 hypothetical protein [Stieleria sp. JC731]